MRCKENKGKYKENNRNKAALSASGFSLMEILVVLAIVGIMMALAMPSRTTNQTRPYIEETLALISPYKIMVVDYYQINGEFPRNNTEAGMPDASVIIGNYLAETEVQDGAIHLTLGKKIRNDLAGKQISLRPVYVPGEENTPISWVCGYDMVPAGMLAAGENRTDVQSSYLPPQCR